MSKKQTIKVPKWLLPASIILNGLFVLYVAGLYVLAPMLADELSVANLNATQNYYCSEKYDAMMSKMTEPQSKMVYAMTVCLKNYKNGQGLNLQPLVDQVNSTDPTTSFSNQ